MRPVLLVLLLLLSLLPPTGSRKSASILDPGAAHSLRARRHHHNHRRPRSSLSTSPPAPPAAGNKWDLLARCLAGRPFLNTSDSAPNRPRPSVCNKPLPRLAHLDLLRDWATALPRLAALGARGKAAPRVVLYPFGGPDLPTVATLFPHADEYVLFGMDGNAIPTEQERWEASPSSGSGTAAAPYKGDDIALFTLADKTKEAYEFFDRASYFETAGLAEMKEGVVPILLAFISTSGWEVLDVTSFTLVGGGRGAKNDARMARDDNSSSSSSSQGRLAGAPAITIGFTRHPRSGGDGKGRRQTVTYVHLDAADIGPLTGYVDERLHGGRLATFLKASGYMFFLDKFCKAREYILRRSSVVLQDDAGLPFACFGGGSTLPSRQKGGTESVAGGEEADAGINAKGDAHPWGVALFGRYSATADLQYASPAGDLYQPGLRDAYTGHYRRGGNTQSPPSPLHFTVGYPHENSEDHTTPESSLILAERVVGGGGTAAAAAAACRCGAREQEDLGGYRA